MSGLGTSSQTSGGVSTTATQPFGPVVGPEANLVNREQAVAGSSAYNEYPTSLENQQYASALGNLGLMTGQEQGGAALTNQAQQYLTGDPGGIESQIRNSIGNINNPAASPGMQGVLGTIQNDVQNSVNSQFAGAGRSLSGLNEQAVARGLSQGEAQPLMAQYNQNISNLQGVNSAQGANIGLGTQMAAAAPGVATAIPQGILAMQQAQRQEPYQNLALQENLLNPIAGLGGTSVGTQTGAGTATSSPLSQFAQGNSALGGGLSGGILGNFI